MSEPEKCTVIQTPVTAARAEQYIGGDMRLHTIFPRISAWLLLLLHGGLLAAAPLQLTNDISRINLPPYFQLLEDPNASLRIGDMEKARFSQPSGQDVINLSYSRSAWWLRLDVDSVQTRTWYLEVGYPSLDSVELFTPDGKGGYGQQRSGDGLAFSQRPLPHHNLLFQTDLPQGKSTLYLRIASSGNLTLPIALWEPQAFHWHDQTSYFRLSLYYGMLLALGLYNLLLFFSLRERVYLYYVLFLGCMAVGIASMNGLAAQFLWPDSPRFTHYVFSLSMGLAGLFASLFVRTFLDTRHHLPRMDKLFRFFTSWYVISALLHIWSYQAGEMMNSFASLLFSPSVLVAGGISLYRKHPGARYFMMAWTALLLGSISLAARNFGLLPTNFFTTHGFQITSALEMLLLSFALADRINTLRREKSRSDARLLQAQWENVAMLKRSEQVLEDLVATRTLELAEANTRLEMLSRQDPLTGLGNRNELELAWNKMAGRSARERHNIGLLLLDLNDFKPINDTYGHEAGDHVLKEVALRLRTSTRISDTVVRLGGDEFVVLLDELAGKEETETIMQKIAIQIAEPTEFQGNTLRVTTSVGCAIYPDDGTTLAELLRQADLAMYRHKQHKRPHLKMETT